MLHQLATCAWVKKGEPLCLIGDSGTGKSHLLIALGTEAAMTGYRVKYTLATKLVNELVEAADDMQLSKTIARDGRVDLLLLDELGYMQLDKRGAGLLFQVLTEREETNSIAIASNAAFSEWTSTFTTHGSASRSSTGSPWAATSSRPAPAPTPSPTPGQPRPQRNDAEIHRRSSPNPQSSDAKIHRHVTSGFPVKATAAWPTGQGGRCRIRRWQLPASGWPACRLAIAGIGQPPG